MKTSDDSLAVFVLGVAAGALITGAAVLRRGWRPPPVGSSSSPSGSMSTSRSSPRDRATHASNRPSPRSFDTGLAHLDPDLREALEELYDSTWPPFDVSPEDIRKSLVDE